MTKFLRKLTFSILLSVIALGTVQAQCTAPSSTVVNNTNCSIGNGTITFTGPTPTANYQYSIDGGNTYGATGQTTFTGLYGGTYSTVSKLVSSGCVSPVINKTITNPAIPANPVSTVVANSNCNTPNGSITFTSPTPLANYQFSIDGGLTFSAAGTVLFPGLTGGSYSTIAKAVASTCNSGITAKAITNPTITAPTSTVTAATSCSSPNGIITFTAQTGYVFSIDGGATFGTTGQTIFPNLQVGSYATQSKVVATGCVSPNLAKTVTGPTVTAPTSTVVNLTSCTAPNGSITFTGPTPIANYRFSIDSGNTFGTASQVVFSNLNAGTYHTVVKLASSGCVSTVVNKAVASQAIATPTSTVVNVTNCSIPNGKITFSAPTPVANYRFSTDGGTSYGTAGQTIFLNLAAGTYATVAQLVSTGCVSPTPAAKIIANPVVAAPTSATATSSCSTPTGSITFTAPTPLTGYSFSVDGGLTYGTVGQTLFSSLPAGTYVTKSKSSVGCVSTASTNKIITNTVTAAPTVAASSLNPTNCNAPNGVINFSGPTPLANYQFSVDGGTTFGTSGTTAFSGLAAGTYVTKVMSVVTGCVSVATNRILTNPTVTVPTATKNNVTDCTTPNGDITFSAPTPIGSYQYSIDGGSSFGTTGQVFFAALSAGTYSPVAKLVSSGCVSNPVANLVITKPAQAGTNKSICQFQPAIMNATALTGATWTAQSDNPIITTIVSPTSATTRINGFTTVGTYHFIWGTASCSDTITVNVGDCLSPIINSSNAFLYQSLSGSGTDIISVDLGTGTQTTLYIDITVPPSGINAVGFNVTDGEIWGSLANGTGLALTGDSIARIGQDGIPHYFVIPGLYSGGYNVGTIDDDGILYLYSSNQTQIFKVDVNPSSPTFLTLLSPVLTTTVLGIADWAYNPLDGFLYGVDNASTHNLYRINRTTGNVLTVGTITGSAAFTAGSYGAAYIDQSGNLYVGDNTAGGVYKISTVQNIAGNTTAVLRSQGVASAGNDGAMNHNACIKPSAGNDTMICISAVATMTATQVSGVAWSAQSNNPGTAVIANPSLANTTISNFSTKGIYHFIWSNGPDCNDTVAVTVYNCITDTIVVPSCDTCSISICNTPNVDLPVNDSTTHNTCGLSATDATFGTISVDANGCALWTPNGTQTASDTVKTCITSCNGNVCDTTYILILPPTPTVPLAINLVYFKGAIMNCQTKLSWQTASLNRDFIVQRGIEDNRWVDVAIVSASGKVEEPMVYGFTDSDVPFGENLYRLKITDVDGKFGYSPVISVNNTCQNASIAIYPNPSKEQQGIHIKINTLELVTYQIFDQTGRIIRTGQFTEQTTIKGLPAGIYFVSANSTLLNVRKKIIIQ